MATRRNSASIYSIQQGEKQNILEVNHVGSTPDLNTSYASLSKLAVKARVYLLGYDTKSAQPDVYQFQSGSPWVTRLSTQLKIGSGVDIIEPFVIGNQPHLMCYRAKDGTMEMFAIGDELSLSKPYRYVRYSEPGLTQGFTTLKPFTCFGQIVFLGYNGENGYVAMYTLSVVASSPANTPPLRMTPVWSHHWAKGWTRFAFFQLGGENFFLKTNTWKPNVNIDHVLDDLSGAVPVGTNLDLKNAQELGSVQAFNLEHGDPYFATYEKNGEVTLNHFNSNCLGWTTVAVFKSKENATHAIPIEVEGKLLLLVT
jgi:hypothetical protein